MPKKNEYVTCDKCGSKILKTKATSVSEPFIANGRRYVRIKRPNGYWSSMTYARYLWTLLDELPDDWVVYHKDGDPLNDDYDNLAAIPKSKMGKHLAKKYLKPYRFKPKH